MLGSFADKPIPTFLELESEPQLHLPRCIGPARTCDLPKIAGPQRSRRHSEVRVIRQIEEISAELPAFLLRNGFPALQPEQRDPEVRPLTAVIVHVHFELLDGFDPPENQNI